MSTTTDVQEAEMRLRFMADAAPVMMWVAGPDKLCTFFNAGWLGFTGRTPEQEMGRGWTEGVHPDDLPECLETYVGAFESRQPFRMEYRLRRHDGAWRWVLDAATARYDADGTFQGYIGSCVDIHEQKETARRLEEVLGATAQDSIRLRAVFDTVPDAIIVIDDRGVVQSFSRAAERTFGYAADEVIGRNVKMLMPSPYHQEHDGYIDRYRRTGERRIIGMGRVVAGLRKNGTTFPLELSVGEAGYGSGRLFVGFIRDITESQATERRLDDLQAELAHVSRLNEMGQMGATLAHELNQPLTAGLAYLGAAQQLVNADAAKEKVVSMIERAVGQMNRAGTIIHRLREFVGKAQTTRRPEPINKVVEEASALALIGTSQLDIQSRIELDPALPVAVVDRIQIQQVLVNLIRNGIEAMADTEKRELLVRTTGDHATMEISVSDSGHGLAPEVAARLFQPFVSTKSKGMGIGLSICRSIIRSHGGDIRAQANEAGPGTTFSFTLPKGGNAM